MTTVEQHFLSAEFKFQVQDFGLLSPTLQERISEKAAENNVTLLAAYHLIAFEDAAEDVNERSHTVSDHSEQDAMN